MNKTKVRSMYERYKKEPDEYLYDLCLETLREEAKKNSIEFKDLINLFNEELDMHYKLLVLTKVLVFLNWELIKNFLYKIINESPNLDYKIIAAEYLTDEKDENVLNYFLPLVSEAYHAKDSSNLRWINQYLWGFNTPKSARVYLEIAKKYPKFIEHMSEDKIQYLKELASQEDK